YNEQYAADNQLLKGPSHSSALGLLNTFGLAGVSTVNPTIGARYSNVLRYQSPNWSGFNFKVAYARPTDGAVVTTNGNVQDGKTNKAINFAPQYSAGPIFVGYSYLKDSDFNFGATALYSGAAAGAGAIGGASNIGTITSSRLSGAYTFPFGLKLGLVYDRSKLEVKSTGFENTEIKRNVWGIPISWTTGPHAIFAVYGRASKLTGSVGNATGAGSTDLSTISITPAGTGAMAQTVGDNSKASMWSLGYQFDLSKRTNVHVNFTQIKNDNLIGYDTFSNPSGMTATTNA